MSLAPHPTSHPVDPPPQSKRGDWTWELISKFPRQGEWTEQEYLDQNFKGFVEFVDGALEFLPRPNFIHQDLVAYLYKLLDKYIGPRSPAEVYFSPIYMRTVEGHIREPDVSNIRAERIPNRRKPANGADLVMEVVSGELRDRERNYQVKREEYAATGITEYWIVDPEAQTIPVLKLDGDEYRVHGEFGPGTMATSVLLPGFQINVQDMFDSARAEQF